MKTINYCNKEYKLPVNNLSIGDDPLYQVIVQNPISGSRCTLPAFAVAVYDFIMGCEYTNLYRKDQRKCLDWFRVNFPRQYMELLD